MLRLDLKLLLRDGGVGPGQDHPHHARHPRRHTRFNSYGWVEFPGNKRIFWHNIFFPKFSRILFFSAGHEAVIVKNGSRLCGTGAARASNPIQQNKAYWEVKVQQSGDWSCGVRYFNADLFLPYFLRHGYFVLQLATGVCDMNKPLGRDSNSWVITSDNTIKTGNETEYTLSQAVQEGDIIVRAVFKITPNKSTGQDFAKKNRH